MKRRSLITAAGAGLFASAWTAHAAGYPDKPIRWIIPFPPGGGTDVITRTLADVMQAGLGQPVVVDNRPGGASIVAVQAMLQNRPDGYTVMTGENSAIVWNDYLFSKLPYNPQKDFTYVGAIGRFPVALVVNPNFPARNLTEFIEHVRRNPGLTYASPGSGTPHHLAMELLRQQAKLEMVHVPYKGSAPASQDVMAGHVPVMMLDIASGLQNIRAGKVRAIAVALPQRAAALPDLPSFAELGMPGVNAYAYFGVIGPAGMPADVVARLNAELNRSLQSPRAAKLFLDTGGEATPGSPAEFERVVRAERARWAPVIKAGAIHLD